MVGSPSLLRRKASCSAGVMIIVAGGGDGETDVEGDAGGKGDVGECVEVDGGVRLGGGQGVKCSLARGVLANDSKLTLAECGVHGVSSRNIECLGVLCGNNVQP